MTDHKGLTLRNGVWLAFWNFQGKRKYKSTGETDLEKAKAKREEFMRPYRLKEEKDTIDYFVGRAKRIDSEIEELERKKPGLLVKDAWNAYMASDMRHAPGERTLANYETQWRRLAEWLAENGVTELRETTAELAKRFCAEKLAPLSPASYNMNLTFFRHVFKVLAPAAKTETNPWELLPKKKKREHSRRELTPAELSKILNGTTGEMKTLFMIGVYTGLRLGDAANLKWESADLEKDMISLVPRKTRNSSGRRVFVPIHPALKAHLESLHGERRGLLTPGIAALYARNKGTPLSKAIQKVFKDFGIETQAKDPDHKNKSVEVGFHSLRHSFVSMCANAGVPLVLVQSLVGHSNPATSEHYFHSDIGALKKAIQTLHVEPAEKTDEDEETAKKSVMARLKSIIGDLRKYGLIDYAIETLTRCREDEDDGKDLYEWLDSL